MWLSSPVDQPRLAPKWDKIVLTTDHSVCSGERPPLCLRGQCAQSGLLVRMVEKLPQTHTFQHWIGWWWWWWWWADHLTFTSASPLRNEPGFWISLSTLSSTQPFVSLLMWTVYEHLWGETFRKCAQISSLLPHVRFSSALWQQQRFNPPLSGAVWIRYEHVSFPTWSDKPSNQCLFFSPT